MVKFSCFPLLVKGKKKNQDTDKPLGANNYEKARETLQIKLGQMPVKPASLVTNSKVMSYESPVVRQATEKGYEAEEEREVSDLGESTKVVLTDSFETEAKEKDDADVKESGNTSDPGIGITNFWGSPKLKRSCSNFETREVLNEIVNSQSFDDLQKLYLKSDVGSPTSATTHCSADKVMLRKHSSSQILPSRSRKLWWKLFLWSHRNLHKPATLQQLTVATVNQQGGYCSDTLEPNREAKPSKMRSPGSVQERWSRFQEGSSSLWLQNQWVAFSAEPSSLSRVAEWVKDLDPLNPVEDEDPERTIIFPPSPDAKNTTQLNISDETSHANNLIRSLNRSSTVAHISGIGLKAVPTISHFSSLRSVNLSNNFIVRITSGSLPKGLHALNLAKNRISTIEGLRELTRLRVLDLSYNRISRIGQGLSNCTLIKELYLSGNKISDVEGLHRLLKLSVLDLSFNKITTAKALGQLVANYNSLLAVNLLGNPIQSNFGDDQLRKTVCSLLPKLVYLNKQPIKQQRAKEIITDSVARAALGNNASSSRRKNMKRGSIPVAGNRGSSITGQKSRNRKTRPRTLKPVVASSSTLAH